MSRSSRSARARHNACVVEAARPRRRGAIVVLAAILMVMMMGLLAFSIDLGYMYTMESQLQRAVDAAALAGAGSLVEGQDAAQERVVEYLVRNPVGRGLPVSDSADLSQKIAEFEVEHKDDMKVALGHWDPNSRSFSESSDLPSTINVSMTKRNNPLFFARFLGEDRFTISASSTAMYQPRDIMVVLDLSGSMNDDTEFNAIDTLGRSHVEANLAQCWADLGNPTYGNMTLDPKYITVAGTPPTSSSRPQINVEYRNTSAFVTSTKSISRVVLRFSNNSTQTFNVNTMSGTYAGTGSNANREITQVTVTSGGNGGEAFDFSTSTINNTIRKALGLNNVAYPYSGSWNDYFDWCKSSSSQNADPGNYRWKFGYKSLLVYWLENKYLNSQTPDLWKVSAQPVTALKDSVNVFLDFIKQVDTDDRVGLAVYNAPNGEGLLESPLTHDFETVANKVRTKQAGHYHNYTNIGGGMKAARQELESRGRPGAFKMMVLMTDGVANWVNGQQNTNAAKNFVISEANLLANKRIPLCTISMGAGADKSLMTQAANITPKGKHFNIPGGQTGEQYREDLIDVFREIAKDRPLKLVH